MLTIAQVSGLIAAAVMIIQYVLPAALVVILVRYVGTRNSAVTWSVVNRAISMTVWPYLFRADSVSTRHVQPSTTIISSTWTVGAALLVVAGVLAPLGLHETIVPGAPELVEFEYVKDPGLWGRVTMPRPNFKFSRECEGGGSVNCPGQYQGVYMNETFPGSFESVKTDKTSTVNLTIPRNYTAMFTSATSDRGNTVSGLFDIQYRRWALTRWSVYDEGQPFVKGDFRYIENLIMQDRAPLLKEGLIVDMTGNPGIGFRNHTIPVGLEHGGTWSEDITWIEPVTRCADTNLSIELRTEDSVDEITDNRTWFIVDRGAFINLGNNALESPPWLDNQTLDLFGRAHKAARMHNVLVASSLNISLPLDPPTKTIPKFDMKETGTAGIFNYLDFETISLQSMTGLGGPLPQIPEYSTGNTSTLAGNLSGPNVPNFVSHYPDGTKKLLALNYSAITQICRGYYEVNSIDYDRRANNITYPAVDCGYVVGAPNMISTNLSASGYSGVRTQQKNVYVCASSMRASIKTVDFRYNGTGGLFQNLEVLRIRDKDYPDEESKPLWAVEHSYHKAMWFESLWGIVDKRYENTDGFYTLRAEKLWLPTGPDLTLNFGATEGFDALAAVSGLNRRLGNLYGGLSSLSGRDYSGKNEYGLFERFQKLSENETTASLIPSLILNDGMAGSLVGTKTSISSKYVAWPASLAVDDTARGFPRARVITYKRVIRYDIRYAIPGFLVLGILLLALLGAGSAFLSSRTIIPTMRSMYNQTSTGRLATNILYPGDPNQSSRNWVEGDGKLQLSFGNLGKHSRGEYFCMLDGDASPKR